MLFDPDPENEHLFQIFHHFFDKIKLEFFPANFLVF